MTDVEMVPVDVTDGQTFDEWQAMFESLTMSDEDRANCLASNDVGTGYVRHPEASPQAGVPRGEFLRFRWTSSVFDGVQRDVWLYVPAQARPDVPVNLLVCNDGARYFGQEVNATYVLDNLIYHGDIPVTAGLFVNPGETGPGAPIWGGSDNRSFEYDTVSGDYGRFVVDELLPVVRSRVMITDDPAGRVICGISSAAAGALTAAFFHPDEFGGVIMHCGSLVNIRGAHDLPSMIRRAPRKAIKVWHQSGAKDLDIVFGNIHLANLDLQAALRYRGYESHYEFGAGGHTLVHGGAVFPDTLRWMWGSA